LSGIGLLLGITGGIVALTRKGSGIGFPIAGCTVCGLSGVVGVVWLVFLASAGQAVNEAARKSAAGQSPVAENLEPRPAPLNKSAAEVPLDAPPSIPTPPSPNESAPRPRGDVPPSTPTDEDQWADASMKKLRSGDATVAIAEAVVDQIAVVELGRNGRSKDKVLGIMLTVGNNSTTRKIDYESWGDTGKIFGEHIPKLTDNYGNRYKRMTFGAFTKPTLQVGSTSIHPDQQVRDIIVFEEPLKNVKYLNLELPASAFGSQEKDLQFRIPVSMIQWK
jgi:hypothetical protein